MLHSQPDQKELVGIFRNWNENWNENKMFLSCNVFIAIQIGFESHLSHHFKIGLVLHQADFLFICDKSSAGKP